ncbi:hypothetical protein C8Q76DRAFT_690716 [Earliella scabrosa]|nr:hypothetical protein C8Q76DRAFT_690716 [Earliella scabrosa]
MPRPSWANAEEQKFLEARVGAWNCARAQGTTTTFIQIAQQEYFDAFFPGVVIPADKAAAKLVILKTEHDENGQVTSLSAFERKKQVYWWFYNKRGGGATTEKESDGGLDLNAAPKKTVRLQAYQAYITLYQDRVLPIIKERFQEYKNDLPADAKPRSWLSFMSETAKKMLEEEPLDVRNAVEAARLKNPEEDGLEMFIDQASELYAHLSESALGQFVTFLYAHLSESALGQFVTFLSAHLSESALGQFVTFGCLPNVVALFGRFFDAHKRSFKSTPIGVYVGYH